MVRSVRGDWDFLRCSLTRCVVVVWRLFLDERLRVGCGSFEVFGGLVVEIRTWEDGGRENESGSFVPFRLEEKGSGSTLLFSESRLLPFGLRSLAKLRVKPQQYHNIGASRGQAPLSFSSQAPHISSHSTLDQSNFSLQPTLFLSLRTLSKNTTPIFRPL